MGSVRTPDAVGMAALDDPVEGFKDGSDPGHAQCGQRLRYRFEGDSPYVRQAWQDICEKYQRFPVRSAHVGIEVVAVELEAAGDMDLEDTFQG